MTNGLLVASFIIGKLTVPDKTETRENDTPKIARTMFFLAFILPRKFFHISPKTVRYFN